MKNLIKISIRNLFRYKRRTLLTSSLITMGVVLVIVFSGLAGSFKETMIGIFTNSVLADLQIHKKGYVESIDNLPLNIFIDEAGLGEIEQMLKRNNQVEAYSPRIKFGAMISDYAQTSNIRLTAMYPEMESKTCPALTERIAGIPDNGPFLKQGEIIVPDILVKGLSLKIGGEVVLVATNKDGSVNGISLKVAGISEGVMGPQGKDGYIHIEDAKTLLRVEGEEISEIAVRVKDFSKVNETYSQLKPSIFSLKDDNGKPLFEIHWWEELSPFSSIAKIIDVLIMMVRVILISIVLISIMNIMMMSVYERISEIGTIAAIGTSPFKIRSLFLIEGFALGIMSVFAGVIIGIGILYLLNVLKISFVFGMMKVTLAPAVPFGEILISSLIVIIVSVLASWQPAHKASKLEPVDALGHV